MNALLICLAQRLTKARIAEEAGACAVMALERVPADIRAEGTYFSTTNHKISYRVAGGVARMVWLAVGLRCDLTYRYLISYPSE